MRADNSAALLAAAHTRRHEALQRVQDALHLLATAGGPVTFTAVAHAASVSRGWLYREPTLRQQVEQLRAAGARPGAPLPAAHRASAQSQHQRITALQTQVSELREDNTRLRNQVAKLLGERRIATARNPSQARNPPVGDMSPTQNPLQHSSSR